MAGRVPHLVGLGGDRRTHIYDARPELRPRVRARMPVHSSEPQTHGYIPLSCQLDFERRKIKELTGIELLR